MPFRPRVVLSMLFVCKIQPEVCSSVCECSGKAGMQLARQITTKKYSYTGFLSSCYNSVITQLCAIQLNH